MHRFEPKERLFAVLLAALAGYVDAFGFLSLGGFFVSFMSGNSTRLAIGLAAGSAAAARAAWLIGLFVAGVVGGSVAGRLAGPRRRAAVLALVTGLLAVASALGGLGRPWPAAAAMVLAMGAENALFEQDGEVQIGLTYMTGALVKLGQRAAGALLGGPAWTWVPYLALWTGLVGGATLGALAFARLGPSGLWIGAAAAALAWLSALRVAA